MHLRLHFFLSQQLDFQGDTLQLNGSANASASIDRNCRQLSLTVVGLELKTRYTSHLHPSDYFAMTFASLQRLVLFFLHIADHEEI